MMTNLTEEKLRQTVDQAIEQNQTISVLRQDVSSLKQDVSDIKQDLHRRDIIQEKMQNDIEVLKDGFHWFGIIQEEIQADIRLLVEAVTPLLKKSEAMSDFDETLKDHSDQIKVTQKALKNHVKNKKAHPTIY